MGTGTETSGCPPEKEGKGPRLLCSPTPTPAAGCPSSAGLQWPRGDSHLLSKLKSTFSNHEQQDVEPQVTPGRSH